MINGLIALVGVVVTFLLRHLPASPFNAIVFETATVNGVTINQILGWVNWLCPFGDCIEMMGLWLLAIQAALAIKVIIGQIKAMTGAATK